MSLEWMYKHDSFQFCDQYEVVYLIAASFKYHWIKGPQSSSLDEKSSTSRVAKIVQSISKVD